MSCLMTLPRDSILLNMITLFGVILTRKIYFSKRSLKKRTSESLFKYGEHYFQMIKIGLIALKELFPSNIVTWTVTEPFAAPDEILSISVGYAYATPSIIYVYAH